MGGLRVVTKVVEDRAKSKVDKNLAHVVGKRTGWLIVGTFLG